MKPKKLRKKIQQLEDEIQNLRGQNSVVPDRPAAPAIATLLLPVTGIRGAPAPVKQLNLKPGTGRVSILFDSLIGNAGEKVVIELNGVVIARAVELRTKNDSLTASVIVPSDKLQDGQNTLRVVGSTDTTELTFIVNRAK